MLFIIIIIERLSIRNMRKPSEPAPLPPDPYNRDRELKQRLIDEKNVKKVLEECQTKTNDMSK